MFWLGLLLTVCFVPGYTGASVPTQWAVLSIILPLSVWRRSPYNPGHTLLFALMLYAGLSGLWSLNLYSWAWGCWVAILWLLAFHWGSIITDIIGLWRGVAVGLYVSVAVAVAQALGYSPVEAAEFQYPGLFYNSSLFGVILGLTLVALVAYRLWWYTPPLVLGLILAGSRGGLLIAGFGIAVRYLGLIPASFAASGFACLAAFYALGDPADAERLRIWGVVLNDLLLFGHGAGSFTDLHYIFYLPKGDRLIRPEFAHNDILQLTYEFGLLAVLPVIVFAMALAKASTRLRPILASWALLALFYFPLYSPLTAFLGFVMAGHALRQWYLAWHNLRDRRLNLLSWHAFPGWLRHLTRRETIPVVARNSSSEG